MKLAASDSDLRQKRIDYDKKHSTIDREKWIAQYDIRLLDQRHDLNKQKMNKDLELEF